MKFLYGKQDLRTLERAQENCFLLTNGLGGYASVTAGFSANRSDAGLLVAAVKAPNERIGMVHRLSEKLTVGGVEAYLSTQAFADGTGPEEGYRNLTAFRYEYVPAWDYQVRGVEVERRVCMAFEKNASAVIYTIDNQSGESCRLNVEPFFKFAPKEMALDTAMDYLFENGRVICGGYTLYIRTNGALTGTAPRWQSLDYAEDAKDGRPAQGMAGSCCAAALTVAAGEKAELILIFSMEEEEFDAHAMLRAQTERLRTLADRAGCTDPVARQLVLAADAFIAHRDSTGGKTILAGYPLFSDWGRDTMIAMVGCTLATKRFEDAKSILRTFFVYEKDGLVPNLFPEGQAQPQYNTVDAALLLIDCVWQYVERTGDMAFAQEAWPVMERIVAAYRAGTHHNIGMDGDGLIHAGGGLDQVTWMDVRVNDILPTPRHGKPVEINAYWYNALKILETLGGKLGKEVGAYAALAEKVKESFVRAFYLEDKGYLKDVVSGTKADAQIRCNQIWAVSMPFTMLSPRQERSVVDTVRRHLHTPCGLRTLSPEDEEYQGFYGGEMVARDMAYHQGTTWVFPMGGYYLAYLKAHGNTPEAASYVRRQLRALEPMLREGCVGQLPEIYNGDHPTDSKGCYAQAWSVGEMLRVYEALADIETER